LLFSDDGIAVILNILNACCKLTYTDIDPNSSHEGSSSNISVKSYFEMLAMDEHAHLSLTARSRQEDRYGDNDDMENGS
jgi:hypothetical protein